MYAAHQSIFPRRAFKIHKTQQIHKKNNTNTNSAKLHTRKHRQNNIMHKL